MIVVDASTLVAALVGDSPAGDSARARLTDERLVAPQLLDIEVLHACRRLHATGAVDERRVKFALADLKAMPIDRIGHIDLVSRCWELRDNLTAYDAAYVAVAELFEIPLVTGDKRLASSTGPRCLIEVVQPSI